QRSPPPNLSHASGPGAPGRRVPAPRPGPAIGPGTIRPARYRSGPLRYRDTPGAAGLRCLQEDAMVQAYILVQTEVGKAADVARQIAEIPGVTQAEDVTGPYDVIVRASAENVDELGKLVAAQIQAVEGITRTLTCPVVHI